MQDTLFRLKKNIEFAGARHCYVLYAAETYGLVKGYIKNKKQRFRIPKVNLDSRLDSSIEEARTPKNTSYEVVQAKRSRKQAKEIEAKKAGEDATAIIQQYQYQYPEGILLSRSHDDEVDDIPNNDNVVSYTRVNNFSAVCYLQNNNIWHGFYFIDSDKLQKSVYDKVFEISNAPTYVINPDEADNITEPEKDIVILKKGVKCNAVAYKDAYKTKKCQTFFTLINTGIYGTEELAKRRASDTRSANHNLKNLSPVKKSVVEDEFYKFLVAKGFTSAQIDNEMEKCTTYQHNSITAARKRLSRGNSTTEDQTIRPAISALRKQQFDQHPSYLSHYVPLRQSSTMTNVLNDNDDIPSQQLVPEPFIDPLHIDQMEDAINTGNKGIVIKSVVLMNKDQQVNNSQVDSLNDEQYDDETEKE